MSVAIVLVLAAFLMTIVAAMGRCPLWVPVLLLTVVHLVGLFPAR